MPKKSEKRGKIGEFYDQITYGINNAANLERNIIALHTVAPGLSKKVGLSAQDVAAIRTVNKKLGRLQSFLYSLPFQLPLKDEDIK